MSRSESERHRPSTFANPSTLAAAAAADDDAGDMGKFRKLGRHAAHRVSMLRYRALIFFLRSPL